MTTAWLLLEIFYCVGFFLFLASWKTTDTLFTAIGKSVLWPIVLYNNLKEDLNKRSNKGESTMFCPGNENQEVSKLRKELGKLREVLVTKGLASWLPRARDGKMQLKFHDEKPIVAEKVR